MTMIGIEIKRRREALGWSKRRLALELGLSHGYQITRWEDGTYEPTAFYLGRLADVFGCTVDELMGRSGPEIRPSALMTVAGCRHPLR